MQAFKPQALQQQQPQQLQQQQPAHIAPLSIAPMVFDQALLPNQEEIQYQLPQQQLNMQQQPDPQNVMPQQVQMQPQPVAVQQRPVVKEAPVINLDSDFSGIQGFPQLSAPLLPQQVAPQQPVQQYQQQNYQAPPVIQQQQQVYNYGAVFDSQIGSQPQPMPSYPVLQEPAAKESSAFESEVVPQQYEVQAQNENAVANQERQEKIVANDEEAQQIKAALKAATGIDSLTEAQWDEMVEKQRKLLAGEEVKEEVKQEQKEEVKKKMGLLDVAKVQWDYFSEENAQKVRIQNIVTNADKARLLREEILKTHSQFDEIRERTEQVVTKSTLDNDEDILKAAQKRMQEHNIAVAQDANGLNGAKVSEVNGKMCVVHIVESSDSLPRLSIMYNVEERAIKNFNSIVGEMIHHLRTLNIPMTENFKYSQGATMSEDSALLEEKARREQAILLTGKYIADCHGRPGADFKAEALFYCEENGYEYRKAKVAYDQDRAFEEEQMRNQKKNGYSKLKGE